MPDEKYSGRKFETAFASMEVPDDSRIAELMEWGERLHGMGLMPAEKGGFAGNMSFRNQKGFVITAGGISKGKLQRRDFVQVVSCSIDQKKAVAEGLAEPSSETFTHYLIYKSRPDVNAIVHVHDDLIMKNAEKMKVRMTAREHEYGTIELAREVEEALGRQKILAVKHHGIVSVGRSIWEAGRWILTFHDKAEGLEGKKDGN